VEEFRISKLPGDLDSFTEQRNHSAYTAGLLIKGKVDSLFLSIGHKANLSQNCI